MPTNLEASKAMLSTPVPVPNQFGSTGMFQTKTNTYDPYTTGDATSDYASMAGSGTGLSQVNEADMDLTGANVGGLVKDTTSSDQWKTFTPERVDPLEEQTNMFLDAYDEGYTSETDSRLGYAGVGAAAGAGAGMILPVLGNVTGAAIGGTVGFLMGDKKGETAEAGTMEAARMARRADRLNDMQVRRKAADALEEDLRAGGMGKWKAKKQARRMKRELRKGARAERREAWKTFKGSRDLQRQEDAYKYAQQYG